MPSNVSKIPRYQDLELCAALSEAHFCLPSTWGVFSYSDTMSYLLLTLCLYFTMLFYTDIYNLYIVACEHLYEVSVLQETKEDNEVTIHHKSREKHPGRLVYHEKLS